MAWAADIQVRAFMHAPGRQSVVLQFVLSHKCWTVHSLWADGRFIVVVRQVPGSRCTWAATRQWAAWRRAWGRLFIRTPGPDTVRSRTQRVMSLYWRRAFMWTCLFTRPLCRDSKVWRYYVSTSKPACVQIQFCFLVGVGALWRCNEPRRPSYKNAFTMLLRQRKCYCQSSCDF